MTDRNKPGSNPLMDFTAIDFETAHHPGWSICQVGLVRVENGRVAHTVDMLIQPPGNNYFHIHTGIHGIDARKTAGAPLFPEIWPRLMPYIESCDVVAHNMPFDYGCLKATLAYYNLPLPEFRRHCTYKIYRTSLNAACSMYSVPLNHHHALSDALACAELFLRKQSSVHTLVPFF